MQAQWDKETIVKQQAEQTKKKERKRKGNEPGSSW